MKKRFLAPLAFLLSWSLVFAPLVPAFAEEGGVEQSETQAVDETVTSEGDAVDGVTDEATPTDEAEATEEAQAPDAATIDGDVEEAATDEEAEEQAVAEGDEDATSDDQAVTEESQESAEPSQDAAAAVQDATDASKKEESEDIELFAASTESEADAFAARHKNTIADGTYALTSKLGSRFALDVSGASKNNGTVVICWPSKVANNQRWEIKNVGGGYVTIKSVNSGKYLQAGWNGKAYSVVQNARATSNRGQLWIACSESGYYKFVSAADLNRVLVVSGGANAKAGNYIYSYLEKSALTANKLWQVSVTSDIQDSFASAHKNDLANGTYFFNSSAASSLRISIKGTSLANKAPAVLEAKANRTIQSWKVTHDSKGYVTFVNLRSGRALDVSGGSGKVGASIIQWTKKESGATNQKWIAVKNANGSYTIYSALTGVKLVLGVGSASASSALKLYQPTGSTTQNWTVSGVPAHFAHLNDVSDGTYLIKTALDVTKGLDVTGASKNNGVIVKLWTVKNSANQLWTVSHDGAAYVHFKNKNSGLHLAFENGKLVQSKTAYPWICESVSGGYRIRDPFSGKYLDVSRSNTNNSTNKIILYTKKDSAKNQIWKITTPATGANSAIMGASQATQAQAVRYLKNTFSRNGWSLPAKWVKDGETVEKIVKYFWEEGAAEGVRGDIALAQSLHETGTFQFGGDVVPAQYNFAGIGTTGGGVKGNYFKNARIGIRAQIQHLKAYASTLPLNQACVDPRFNYVSRGCSPTIAGLARTWAVDPSYAQSITAYLNAILSS